MKYLYRIVIILFFLILIFSLLYFYFEISKIKTRLHEINDSIRQKHRLHDEEINSCIYANKSDIYVIDGDTIHIKKFKIQIDDNNFKINDIKIRLYGIDAPEIKQKCKFHNDKIYNCGINAKDRLQHLLSKTNKVKILQKDKYGRYIAIIYNDKNEDINKKLVHEGLAIAYKKYSQDYIQDEEIAKINKSGIWADDNFIIPEEYRKNKNK